MNRIGITYCKQGGHEDDAIKYYSKRISISKKLGDIRGEGYGLSNAAECYASKGQLETALDYCERALKIFTKMDEKRMVANTMMVYGIVYGYKSDWASSFKYFNDSIEIAKSIDSLDMEAQIYFNFGFTARDMGDHLKSSQAVQSGPAVSTDSGTNAELTYFKLPADAAEAYKMARENLQQAISLYQELKNEVKVKRLTAELVKIP